MKIYKLPLLITVLFVFSANEIQAYDCGGYGTLADEIKSSAAVFSGKVIAKEYKKVSGDFYTKLGILEVLTVTLIVDRWWKGSGDLEVLVYPGGMRGSGFSVRTGEDFNFTIDKSYLVYARADKNFLLTNNCTRTKTLDRAEEDLKTLGEGVLPKPIVDNNLSVQSFNLLLGNFNILSHK